MFARRWAYLHTAQFPVPKNLAAKSRVSTTSKLIEIKALQVLHFGHLQKTGGRGSYRLVHTADPVESSGGPFADTTEPNHDAGCPGFRFLVPGSWVTLSTLLCSGRFSDRRRFNGVETRYFFGCGCGCGGASLVGGTMFFSRMYVTRLP